MAASCAASRSLRIAFIHPDLGLGGAERLIVDAAVELRAAGHDVHLYTAHHDPGRCFGETLEDGQRAPWVHVHGNWLPRTVLGRLHAVCAYLRCLLLALALLSAHMPYHVVILDQVSAPIPLIRLASRAKVLFYCHFPDMLLATRASRLRAAYRAPLDALEQSSTGWAHAVVVNSNYTAGIFAATFTRLHALGVRPEVLYPAAALPPLAHLRAAPSAKDVAALARAGVVGIPPGARLLLSINRFERKKGLPLALRSLAELRSRGAAFSDVHLVIAGGYDARLAENVEHLRELRAEAQLLQLSAAVTFLPSFSDAQKAALLAAATLVLYTPQHEHFGMVPLEAMAAQRPVVACASGGPLESIVDGETGALCPPTPAAFAHAAARLLLDPAAAEREGVAARRRVEAHFSRASFGTKLNKLVLQLAE